MWNAFEGLIVHRLIVGLRSGEADPAGEGVRKEAEVLLKKKINSIKTRRVYTIDADLDEEELGLLTKNLFVDPVSERPCEEVEDFDWLIEIGYKPGVTDNVGNTSKNVAIPGVIKRKLGDSERVYTSTRYLISGGELSREEAERIANKLLANQIIETAIVVDHEEAERTGIPYALPVVKGDEEAKVLGYDLKVGDEELMRISEERVLSLNLEEMRKIRDYFQREEVIAERAKMAMAREFWDRPTDVELEAIAQTWSEHCKHKIFNSVINYRDEESGAEERIDGLFNTYIKRPSEEISARYGWVVSAFSDNAGIVRFNDRLLVADKIETHNAPSALEPYGGAITGIVGVNRDILGAGRGARPIFNVFGYCFGSPFYDKQLPEGVLHPRRIRDGVHKGVRDGGNQSGIPLVSGWEFFDERFTFRPLVYCGTIGIMPLQVNGEASHIKIVEPSDLIVMVGGKIGKDGIHGATFSSAELHKESPVQAVQIGDPITQKKMGDFLLEARDLGFYRCITDNGAGGLSSSVGETAGLSDGCVLYLEKAPLKYQGLQPWEILLSEAQERMTIAVEPSKLNAFLELAKKRDVEATVLGSYSDSGKFHVAYKDRTVAYIDMEFLHEGVPRMTLAATWKKPLHEEPGFGQPKDMNKTLEDMMVRLNVCSKENMLRQYDHEVKGLSVIKLLVGKDCDVQSDATVSFLEYGSMEGLAVAFGVNPRYSEIDTYHMAASVIDEAVRRIIAVGGKLPGRDTVFYALDNFCWNISSLASEDGRYKMAQLVRANKALADYCRAFGIPCISGKDSMKNVWKTGDKTVFISPTLLFSARAKIADVSKAVTMDTKRDGDLVYVVGRTYEELGGSEYYSYAGEGAVGNNVPKVDAEKAKKTYAAISEAVERETVHSIHTPTLGGLGVALAECSFAGGYGMEIDLRKVPYQGRARDDYLLFSESNSRFVVTIPPKRKREFEGIMENCDCAEVGTVTSTGRFKAMGLSGSLLIDLDLDTLKLAWKRTLGDGQ